jgi:capsular polysaccharide biosynthesis protein
MLDQQIPLQSLNRTVFDYDVIWYGSDEFYAPPMNHPCREHRLLALHYTPQVLAQPYYYLVSDAVLYNKEAVDPARPDRVLLEIFPDVTRATEGEAWHFGAQTRKKAVSKTVKLKASFSKGYLFSDIKWYNYYHFIVDSCLRFVELRDVGALTPDMALFFHSVPNRWQSEYLDLLEVSAERTAITPQSYRHPWKVDQLLIGSPRRERFVCSRRAIELFRAKMFERVGISTGRRDRDIYISRRSAEVRRVVNEDDVRAVVERCGYEVVELEALSVADQIRLFAGARRIVAPHGAGLTNIIYAEQPRVLELLPADTWMLGFFVSLTNVMGGQHVPLVSRLPQGTVALGPTDNYLGDFVVDVDALKRLI